jgi:hypothetical protein
VQRLDGRVVVVERERHDGELRGAGLPSLGGELGTNGGGRG